MQRRHIGIVFQFFNLLEGMSLRENVALPAVVAGSSRGQADSRALDLLDFLGIADRASLPTTVTRGWFRPDVRRRR
jgi:putative ABC transport system ATP-binding protein